MTRKRNQHPAAEVATPDEDQARQAPGDGAVPDDLTAAALALRQAAIDADEQAVRRRAEAESVVSASRAEADRMIREGQAKALPLIADAAALERKATDLGGRSKHLEHAARQEAFAEVHEAKAAKLTEAAVVEIRSRRANGAMQKTLAADYGVSDAYVSEIVNGLVWRHAGGPISGTSKRTSKRKAA